MAGIWWTTSPSEEVLINRISAIGGATSSVNSSCWVRSYTPPSGLSRDPTRSGHGPSTVIQGGPSIRSIALLAPPAKVLFVPLEPKMSVGDLTWNQRPGGGSSDLYA